MNIGIDARPLEKQKTGIGNYLKNILDNLSLIDKSNEYYLFSDREIYYDCKSPNFNKIVDKKSILKKTPWYLLRVNRLIKKYDINIFWGTQHILPLCKCNNIKMVLTIHDMVLYEMPQTMSTYNRLIMKYFIPMSVKKANEIICVSNSTKKGLNKHLGKYITNQRQSVIYLASEEVEIKKEQEKDFFTRYKDMTFIKKSNYLLYVGTIEPRKNIALLLKAFEKIREKVDIKLLLCGKVGWKCENILFDIKNHKFKKDIYYLDYVSNIDKYLLMKNAFAFIFPSYYEGFGLPVVESMKMGTVTLVANKSSLKEIIEKEELKFNLNSDVELVNKILELYRNNELYNICKLYCKNRSNYFSWHKAASKYLDIFNNEV